MTCLAVVEDRRRRRRRNKPSSSSSAVADGRRTARASLSPSAAMAMTVLLLAGNAARGFAPAQPSTRRRRPAIAPARPSSPGTTKSPASSSTTALNVWWFGGTENDSTTTSDDDSCELVAVRIDRTSANSRRIAGDITVPAPIDDVWAILTDYDNLAIHVPNLVESKRVYGGPHYNAYGKSTEGEPGDGQYKCRLFQKGAQKIVGFEFGASVTMDMTEQIVVAGSSGRSHPQRRLPASGRGGEGHNGIVGESPPPLFDQERRIGFKCVESPFFSEFDGEWSVVERPNANAFDENDSPVETTLSYVVDVRPRGPVPVLALEWRIREDVPTNLRAVKKASLEVGQDGVMAMREGRQRRQWRGDGGAAAAAAAAAPRPGSAAAGQPQTQQRRAAVAAVERAREMREARERAAPSVAAEAAAAAAAVAAGANPRLEELQVEWYEDETMAAYLTEE